MQRSLITLTLASLLSVGQTAAQPADNQTAAQPADAQTAAQPADEQAEKRASLAAPTASFDLARALRNGPPLSAARAAELALADSPTLDRVQALSQASAASVQHARALMLPHLALSGSYMRIGGFPNGSIDVGADAQRLSAARQLVATLSDPAARMLWAASLDAQQGGQATIEIPRNQFDVSAQLTWPVSDLFLSMLPALDAAKASARADQAKVAATEAQVRREAQEAFYQLARARGALAVAEEAERQARVQAQQIVASTRAGFLTNTDLLDGEARVAGAGQAVAAARAGVEIADAALRTIIGADEGPVFGIDEPILENAQALSHGARPDKLPGEIDALVQTAVHQRPEVSALEAAADAHRATEDANDGAGYPHLALVAGAGYASPNRYVIPPTSTFYPSFQLGAVVTWSPNDALTHGYDSDSLAARGAALQAQLDELKRGVQLEVRRAVAELRAAHEAIAAARAARTSAEAAYASRLSQLRAGHATITDLFSAEGQLNRARLAELDAAVQLRLAETHLAYATGS